MELQIEEFLKKIQSPTDFKEKQPFQNEFLKKTSLQEINQKLRDNSIKLGRLLFISQNEIENIVIATSKSWILHFDQQFELQNIFGCDIDENEIELEDISCLKFQNNLIFVGFNSGYSIIYDTLSSKKIIHFKPSENPLIYFYYSEKKEIILILDSMVIKTKLQFQKI